MNYQILYKYIDGSCSKEELAQLAKWLQEKPSNEDFFKTFIENAYKEKNIEFEADAQKAWREFQNKHIHKSNITSISGEHDLQKSGVKGYTAIDSVHKRNNWHWYYAAAAAMIIITALFYYFHSMVTPLNTGSQLAFQNITTSKGQRKTLELNDGTHIILNSDSKISIPKNYGHASRTIYLQGEAFFKVVHNKNHPFMVVANHTFVKDIGTQFNVMAYDSAQIIVAVKQGLVSFGKVKQGKPLKELGEISPNRMGVLENTGKFTLSNISDLNRYTGWTDGKLVFRNTPFKEVVKRLERWYDIDCKIEDPNLKNRTLTATYDNMSMDDVLKVLSLSLNINYEQHNKTIIFRDK
jgi:ferric-dicitrate binding protein FerR (iron transport regulator)